VGLAVLADIGMEISLAGEIKKNILQELGLSGKEDALPPPVLVASEVGNL